MTAGYSQPNRDMIVFLQPAGDNGLQLMVSHPKVAAAADSSKRRKLDDANTAAHLTMDARGLSSMMVLQLRVKPGGEVVAGSTQRVKGQPDDGLASKLLNTSGNVPLSLHIIVNSTS